MIKHIQNSDINKKKWDNCITNAFNSLIYAHSWYLDIVSPGWEALVKGDYETIMPLTQNRKYGFHYLYQPPFTQQLGVFSLASLTENDTRDFLSAIPEKFRFVEINLNASNGLIGTGFSVKKNTSLQLNLDQPYEKTVQNYSENTKRNIGKALKNGLRLKISQSPEKIVSLFRQNRGKMIKTLTEKHYLDLGNLVKELIKRDSVQILTVETKEGQLLSGAIFAENNRNAVFLFSGADEDSRNKGAMFFLIDRFIFENATRIITLDFNGSNDSNLSRFYKGFGAIPSTYLQIRKNDLPGPIKWLKDR